MPWQLATLALILLGFAAISRRIEGTSITAPMVFTAVGIVVGARVLGLVDLEQHGEEVKLLTEATLTVVLFYDASRIDLRALRPEAGVHARLLGIGLPLTLLTGGACGRHRRVGGCCRGRRCTKGAHKRRVAPDRAARRSGTGTRDRPSRSAARDSSLHSSVARSSVAFGDERAARSQI